MFNQDAYNQIKTEIPNQVKIIAVTKTKSIEDIKQAIKAGIKIIGENYVQEAEEKYKILKHFFKDNLISFHLIGHLQSNKVKTAVKIFDCIETIDSEKIAIKVNKECQKINKIMEVFIEINFGEEQKSGIAIENLSNLIKIIKKLKNLNLLGLMTIVKVDNRESCFKKMNELKKEFGLKELSMGMSKDYLLAIKEGSTNIRLGKILFGERE